MKKSKLKLLTKILTIVVISLISFVGLYVQKQNYMRNIIKGYDLSKDLSGYRQVMFEISDAKQVKDSDGHVVGNTDDFDDEAIKSNSYKKTKTSVNNEEKLNKENYEASKTIIEKRLKLMGVDDYNLSLEKETGKLYLQISENDNTDRVISNIIETGSFEIKDSKDNTVFISKNHLKKAEAMYYTDEPGTTVYLQIELNKEGTEILTDLSTNKYVTIEESVTASDDKDKEEKEDKEEQKEIVLSISGNNMITTSFEEPIQDGKIQLSMSSASKDNEEINEALRVTSTYVTLLQSDDLPLIYKVTQNQYMETDISDTIIRNILIVTGAIVAILLVFMIIKNKLRGILGAFCYIGFIALYLLLIRYTNVVISIAGALAIVIIGIINYILNLKLLSIDKDDNNLYKQEYVKFIAKMIPLLIISIVFIFIKWVPLSSFGMLLFWGIILMMLYNILVTKNVIN